MRAVHCRRTLSADSFQPASIALSIDDHSLTLSLSSFSHFLLNFGHTSPYPAPEKALDICRLAPGRGGLCDRSSSNVLSRRRLALFVAASRLAWQGLWPCVQVLGPVTAQRPITEAGRSDFRAGHLFTTASDHRDTAVCCSSNVICRTKGPQVCVCASLQTRKEAYLL